MTVPHPATQIGLGNSIRRWPYSVSKMVNKHKLLFAWSIGHATELVARNKIAVVPFCMDTYGTTNMPPRTLFIALLQITYMTPSVWLNRITTLHKGADWLLTRPWSCHSFIIGLGEASCWQEQLVSWHRSMRLFLPMATVCPFSGESSREWMEWLLYVASRCRQQLLWDCSSQDAWVTKMAFEQLGSGRSSKSKTFWKSR